MCKNIFVVQKNRYDTVLRIKGKKVKPKNFKHLKPVMPPSQKPVSAKAVMTDTVTLLKNTGEIKRGVGLVGGVVSLSLAILCLLGVLAFHFPQYLTTPELRHKYDVGLIRHVMMVALFVSGAWSLYNTFVNRSRTINLGAFLLVLVTIAMGGSRVPVGDFPDNTPYLGLDWFILDLLGSAVIFILIEKLWPLRKNQMLFRKDWQNDLMHFGFNHLLIGFMLLVVNFTIHNVFGWMIESDLQSWIHGISYIPQLLLCVFVADFVEYWTHRAYHEVPFLWKYHSVHHSAEFMDWLAGSRLHLFEIIVTRVLILGALYVVGFDKAVLDGYIIIVGFQAVFNHANVHFHWGPFRYIFVTPDFHHWHHASDDEAIDRNYAAHFSFIDYIFKTAVDSEKRFPDKYGVVGDYVPRGFINQQLFPLIHKNEKEN